MSWLDDLPRCPKTGKFGHPSAKSAWAQIASLEAAGKPVSAHEHPYRCPWCPYWHVGHDRKALNRSIRKALRQGNTATRITNRRRRR